MHITIYKSRRLETFVTCPGDVGSMLFGPSHQTERRKKEKTRDTRSRLTIQAIGYLIKMGVYIAGSLEISVSP
jgi:hypothetical protein